MPTITIDTMRMYEVCIFILVLNYVPIMTLVPRGLTAVVQNVGVLPWQQMPRCSEFCLMDHLDEYMSSTYVTYKFHILYAYY